MTFGSLFAGIGGFDLGLERAGLVCKWQVEIDPFCRAVLAKHWPDVRRYDDVRTVGAHNLESVDVLCGGFPCQDISVAGKGAGLAGKRSGLWSEYARLIGALRPRYVLVENVSALLGRGLGRVLGDLAESGYDAEWDCLPASAFGAPHQRDRIWLVAYPERRRRGAGSAVRPRAGGPLPQPARPGEDMADADCERQLQPQRVFTDERRRVGHGGSEMADAQRRGGQAVLEHEPEGGAALDSRSARVASPGDPDGGGWWRTEPDVGRVAHGVPARVDRLRGLGNAIVPQIAEWLGRRLMEAV